VIAGICRRVHPTRRREVTWTKILCELRILDHPSLVIQKKASALWQTRENIRRAESLRICTQRDMKYFDQDHNSEG
jgi:hypothetical protein